MDTAALRKIIFQSILDLSCEEGIYASGRNEAYGCVFGRDSAISILKILKASANTSSFSPTEIEQLREICRKGLLTLASLQGQEVNIESGEEPGKFIHEYRKNNYERVTSLERPWFVYPDGIMRNYDSLDATPLALIAIYRYWQATHDHAFLMQVLPAVEKGLDWIMIYGDRDGDHLLEYTLHEDRKHGGLRVQSWTDSTESLLDGNGTLPAYPIAPVEVQGYAWLALKLWSGFYAAPTSNFVQNSVLAGQLAKAAKEIKKSFNRSFIFKDNGLFFAAQALDGNKRQIRTVTGNPLLLLWAGYKAHGTVECVLDDKYIDALVERSMQSDIFDPDAGIRTMSTKSPTYNPSENSYHSGSYWPKLNGMAHEGLVLWGYRHEANMLKEATLKPIAYFGSPIELYVKNAEGVLLEYRNEHGQVGCRQQAWSAATALDLLSHSDATGRKKTSILVYRAMRNVAKLVQQLEYKKLKERTRKIRQTGGIQSESINSSITSLYHRYVNSK